MTTRLLLIALTIPALAGEMRTGWYRGNRVTYEVVDGQAILGGDILLEQVDNEPPVAPPVRKGARRESLYTPTPSFRWTNATIPYVIDPALPNPQRVLDAIANWQAGTPIRFVQRTTEVNYLSIQPGSACNSGIGMIGGKQAINLTADCGVVPVMHELGHAIGFDHEHQRPDRDRYIRFNLDSMSRAGWNPNFINYIDHAVDGPYDYGSFMHYQSNLVSDRSRPNFETIPIGIPTETTTYLSPVMVNTVKKMYGFALSGTTVTTVPAGLQILVDGVSYTSPVTFNWALNSPHTIEYKDLQGSASTRYRFAHWSDQGARQHSVTITQEGTVLVANCVREWKVAIAAQPSSAGTLSVFPASADGFYPQGSPLTLTAAPANGYIFGSFGGRFANPGLGLSANPQTLPLVVEPTIPFTAAFVPSGSSTTTLKTNWPYSGLTVDGSANQFGPNAEPFWTAGSAHTISAVNGAVNEGYIRYIWDNWADGGPQTRSIVHPGGTFTANFHRQFQLVLNQAFSGVITASPASADGFYDEGTVVTVTAVPNSGNSFLGWDQDLTGQANPATVTMRSQVVIGGYFSLSGGFALQGDWSAAVQAYAVAGTFSKTYPLGATNGGAHDFSVATQDSWIAVSPSSGSTPANLTFSVNPTGLTPGFYRTPVLITVPGAINSPRIVLVEMQIDPPSCAYNATQGSTQAAQGGDQVLVQVITNANCSWKATSPIPGIGFGLTSGSGPATVAVVFPANPGPTRTVPLTIAGLAITIQQPGSNTCTYSLSSNVASAPAGASAGSVNVTTQAGCPWTATSNDAFVTVTGSASGIGSGPVTYSVAANNGAARSGVMSIAGTNFTVNQASACSSASLASPLANLTSGGGAIDAAAQNVSLTITLNSACDSSISSAAGWITSSPGTGSRTLAIPIAANTIGTQRVATIVAAGQSLTLTQRATTAFFNDVAVDHFAFDAVGLLRAKGVTSGTSSNPPLYSPDAQITRGQMAVFIIRTIFGGDNFTYDSTPYFTDAPTAHGFFKWIQKMKELGITSGTSPTTYGPDAPVTRGQMAVFIVRARYGPTAAFGYSATPRFTDVPATSAFFSWIQKMGETGITAGCGTGIYCPNDVVTRGQMAIFVMRGLFNQLFAAGTP